MVWMCVLAAVMYGAGLVQPLVGGERAEAEPEKGGRVLIFSMTKGYRHDVIPLGQETLAGLARELGLEPVVSDELAHFDPERIGGSRVIVFNNTTGELPLSGAQREALLKFVSDGGGFVGVHAASDTLYEFTGYGVMLGGYFDGHPWNAGDTVTLKVEEPGHPVAKPLGEGPWTLREEIYQFRAPYDRAKVRVLLSLDVQRTDMRKPGVKRTDGDFALSWVRRYGEGRVFYCALGHNREVWEDAKFRGHLREGLRYAAGLVRMEDGPRR